MKWGRSPSLTAVNFRPSPHPGFTCRTTASALICPSWTRKSTLALEPTGLGLAVSTNRPPRLTSRTCAVSSRSLHRQKTQTPPGVSIRGLNRLEGEACCNRWHLRWPSHLLCPFVWFHGLKICARNLPPGKWGPRIGSEWATIRPEPSASVPVA
jgi:hypothetical protein